MGSFVIKWWKWGELNSRPNIFTQKTDTSLVSRLLLKQVCPISVAPVYRTIAGVKLDV